MESLKLVSEFLLDNPRLPGSNGIIALSQDGCENEKGCHSAPA